MLSRMMALPINEGIDIPSPVASLAIDSVTERIIPCRSNVLYVPQRPHEQVEWGFVDQSMKLVVDRKVWHRSVTRKS